MGYDLHLTRSEDWADAQAKPITLVEFQQGCRDAGFTLRPDGDSGFQLGRDLRGGGVLDLISATLSDGQVTLKPAPPDRDSADRLMRLATTLHARLQGDDGEVYDQAPVLTPPRRRRPRFWPRR